MRVLSGIQPTGNKTIGNYIGAIRNYVALQDKGDAYYLIVDMHALTTLPEGSELAQSSLSTAALLMAAGLDPDTCTVFVQSQLAGEHAQMQWILSCIASYGQLGRMTQFKDKSAKAHHINVGLFTYPVLQAADILLYDIDQVPIGHDQKQHLELARDIAMQANSRYKKELFVAPEPFIPDVGGRVMDLQEPTNKMSTSDGHPKGTVYVLDDPKVIERKFKSAVTDSETEVYSSRDKPGITNLLEIFSVSSGRSIENLENEYRTKGYGTFKAAVADSVIEYLRPVRERHAEIMQDKAELTRILEAQADKARHYAHRKLAKVRKTVGFRL